MNLSDWTARDFLNFANYLLALRESIQSTVFNIMNNIAQLIGGRIASWRYFLISTQICQFILVDWDKWLFNEILTAKYKKKPLEEMPNLKRLNEILYFSFDTIMIKHPKSLYIIDLAAEFN